ncbi:MAG: 50S ribosomal protein L3 N(5)-glutamine methyltransferase [Gammaproteobacteria bacterium]
MSNSSVIKKPQTIRQFVEWAVPQFEQADLFYGHGTDNAQDEAVYLIFGVLQTPFDVPESALDSPLTESQCEKVTAIIQRRIETRQPAAYLLGEAWFCGLPFYVNDKVLVPRSPFAELILDYFQPWLTKAPTNILDIGTGSGCIAIACALAFPEAKVDAADISDQALDVAAKNVQRHELEDRMRLIKSDVFSGINMEVDQKKYDLIVSNPPYVSAEDVAALPDEYHHEPVSGLEGGGDGLDIVRRIMAEARQYLTDDGLLIVEVGLMQEAMDASFPALPITWLDFEQGGEGVFLIYAADL